MLACNCPALTEQPLLLHAQSHPLRNFTKMKAEMPFTLVDGLPEQVFKSEQACGQSLLHKHSVITPVKCHGPGIPKV